MACRELERALDVFYNDPITDYYGVGADMAPALIASHVRRHGCSGLDDPGEVWCVRCEQPATREADVTVVGGIERQALCDRHYYALMRATKAR